ncbi:hypothetical protein KAU33_12800 [Candidatus Dependentiae bacterium]|nr:hypothetical protein [Candidatus Dependentiae bacterium]
MALELGYQLEKRIDEDIVKQIWMYIAGPLLDLYGARTWLNMRRDIGSYVIIRYGAFHSPQINKLLEINLSEDRTQINCYFTRPRDEKKIRAKLETIVGQTLTSIKPQWQLTNLTELTEPAPNN